MKDEQSTGEDSLEDLRRRHQELDRRIAEESRHPGADDLRISQMKREKLRLRDAIAEAERREVG